jgi:hypothetical protein
MIKRHSQLLQAGDDGRFSVENTVKPEAVSVARADSQPDMNLLKSGLTATQPVEVRLRQVPQHRITVTDMDNGDQPLAGASE